MTIAHMSGLGWYARRAVRMSPLELTWRARDHARRATWSTRQVRRDHMVESDSFPARDPPFTAGRLTGSMTQ